MAVLEQIRTRAGILISVVIGVALFAFIVNDALSSGRIGRGKNLDNVGIIKGKEIKYSDFIDRYEFLEKLQLARMRGITSLPSEEQFELKNRIWNEYLQEKVYMYEAIRTGLAVHSSEVNHLIEGPNPHPLIRQSFSDQNGVLNRELLNRARNQLRTLAKNDPQYLSWVELNDQIHNSQLIQKYLILLEKGSYITNLEAKRNYINAVESADIEYIVKRFNSISDSSVAIKKSELKEYYKKHKEEYKQEESVDLTYVAFEIIPSELDYTEAKTWINEQIEDFRNKNNIYKKVKGEIYEPEELSEELDSFMFSSEQMSVYGPYLEEETYKVAVLDSVLYLPDSVKVSHILVPYGETEQEQYFYYSLSDSIYNLAKEGYDFDQLVQDNSADPMTRENNGDMGWINNSIYGRMFDDSCYFGNVGDVKLVSSGQGLHIIKITEQSADIKKVQVNILERHVRPSDETDRIYYDKANSFAYENNTVEKFNSAIRKGNYVSNSKYNLSSTTLNIDNLENSREFVRWAFQAEEGELSRVKKFGNFYVVGIVEKVRNKGIIPFEDLQDELTAEVMKEKKGKMLLEQMKKAKAENASLEGIASKLNMDVESADNVMFTTASSMTSGGVPVSLNDISGVAINLEMNTISEPILGENGVYIVKVINKTPADLNNINYDTQKNIMVRNEQNIIVSSFFEVLEEEANIKDFRVHFY